MTKRLTILLDGNEFHALDVPDDWTLILNRNGATGAVEVKAEPPRANPFGQLAAASRNKAAQKRAQLQATTGINGEQST